MSCMKRAFSVLAILLILAVLTFSIFRFIALRTPAKSTKLLTTNHLIGGFSITTPASAVSAATNGVQVAFEYGQPPASNSKLGQQLQLLHMKVIDGYISSMLHYYECHRLTVLTPLLPTWQQYCQGDYYPYLSDESVLLRVLATHLQQVEHNSLVIGYWVLDDWLAADAGSARQILIDIHKLIQHYTPQRPAICGIGGLIKLDAHLGWSDWVAANFSPQGCDKVGLYLYTAVLPTTTLAPSSDMYDWSMSELLPQIFTSLERRGWSSHKEPLIGIAQAFGGPRNHTNFYSVVPTAKNIETQSRSFCEHGASELTFYGWYDSEFGPTTSTPLNDKEIQMGIHKGIAACVQYWHSHAA